MDWVLAAIPVARPEMTSAPSGCRPSNQTRSASAQRLRARVRAPGHEEGLRPDARPPGIPDRQEVLTLRNTGLVCAPMSRSTVANALKSRSPHTRSWPILPFAFEFLLIAGEVSANPSGRHGWRGVCVFSHIAQAAFTRVRRSLLRRLMTAHRASDSAGVQRESHAPPKAGLAPWRSPRGRSARRRRRRPWPRRRAASRRSGHVRLPVIAMATASSTARQHSRRFSRQNRTRRSHPSWDRHAAGSDAIV